MMNQRWPIHVLGAAALAGSLLTAGPARALGDVTVYGVAHFNAPGQCNSGLSSHDRHLTSAANFRATFDTMIAAGWWDTATTRNDTAAHGTYFTDAAKGSSTSHSCCEAYQPSSCSCAGEDLLSTKGVDASDVVFIHTHGGSTLPAELPAGAVPFMGLAMGNESYDCRPRSHEDWRFGNGAGTLDIAVVQACQSMDFELWQGKGHWQFESSASTFTMWNAYHGNVPCTDARTTAVGLYAADTIWNGAGDNWMDLMHEDDWWWDADTCPMSLVFGSSPSVREHMYEYGGWKDRQDTGTKSGSTLWHFAGCDPRGGSALP